MYLNCLRYIIGNNDLSGTILSELGLLTNLDRMYLGKYVVELICVWRNMV